MIKSKTKIYILKQKFVSSQDIPSIIQYNMESQEFENIDILSIT